MSRMAMRTDGWEKTGGIKAGIAQRMIPGV